MMNTGKLATFQKYTFKIWGCYTRIHLQGQWKVKVTSLLDQLSNPRHEDVWWSGGTYPCILDLGRVNGQLQSPSALPPRERSPCTHRIEGRARPRASVYSVEKRKSPVPAGNRTPIPGLSSSQPVLISTELYRLLRGRRKAKRNLSRETEHPGSYSKLVFTEHTN
jgi:hypothetical protein